MSADRGLSLLKMRLWIAAASLLVPSLSLIPFGVIWLWQKGYVLYWVFGACAFVILAFGVQLLLLRRAKQLATATPIKTRPDDHVASDSWTLREEEAWQAVLAISAEVKIDHLASWEAFLGLGEQTIQAVAQALHPEVKNPLWQFTVPEALTLIEEVSLRLKPMVVENVPLGDQMTIGQVLRIYQWRSAIDIAQKGYDIWRIIRFMNPITAGTQELRERLSKQMYQWGREEIAKRLAGNYVKEVGRAAIDLYGGRLRVSETDLKRHMSTVTKRDKKAPQLALEPLRILVGGQVKAGKSSCINALFNEIRAPSDALPLTDEFTAYELKHENLPQALILDNPGLADLKSPLEALIRETAASDLILWVVNAARADRDIDKHALNAVRQYFNDHPNRRRPPMFLVLSHIDRLRPFYDWNPPYELSENTTVSKAVSIQAALEAVGHDLGFKVDDIIPACLDAERGLYNVDLIWSEIVERVPEAQRAQLVRAFRDFDSGFDWKRVRSQALNAGRILGTSLFKRLDKDTDHEQR